MQDKSSQICCYLLGVEDGQRVLDVCAAPGGKTMTLSQYAGKNGEIVSCDIYNHKLKLIDDTAKRLGLENVKVLLRDGANDKTDIGSFDRILCDVPCSGFGVTAKKPEIKYKSQAEIKDLPTTAMKILENSARLLKKGGRLVYSTCTLLPEENRDVCNAFLLNHSEFKSVAIDENISGFRDGDYLTIMPYDYDCDDFFVAVFERS